MSLVSIEDFKKLDLRTAKILEAEEIVGADRIWKLLIDVGAEKKTIVAGVKSFYSREALIGKQIVVVNNLEPAVIRGVSSQGMLLAAKNGDKTSPLLSIISPERELPSGSVVG
ncbi:MAG: methionine--tRNA ligase subunit beta [Candidatus Omnitrophica bacterium]|nr:methionine--tRNA ligase subunit beta [Candidatus Omnitrophota bacterium]